MKEDTLAKAIVQHTKENDEEADIHVEHPYNNFGSRGYVDLFIEKPSIDEKSKHLVLELKSASAVEAATGANEIIRQFHKHRKYFYKDDDNNLTDKIHFELAFTPERENLIHILKNKDLYMESNSSDMLDNSRIEVNRKITMKEVEPGVGDAFIFCADAIDPVDNTDKLLRMANANNLSTEFTKILHRHEKGRL